MTKRIAGALAMGVLVVTTALAGCRGKGDRAAPLPENTVVAAGSDGDGGSDGGGMQPMEAELCRRAVERFARIRGLVLEPGEMRQFTLWCLDGPSSLAICMAETKTVKDVERCERLAEPGGTFGTAAEVVATRPNPQECDTAIKNMVRLVPETARDKAAFLSACLSGSRAQMACVAAAVRDSDLSRCP